MRGERGWQTCGSSRSILVGISAVSLLVSATVLLHLRDVIAPRREPLTMSARATGAMTLSAARPSTSQRTKGQQPIYSRTGKFTAKNKEQTSRRGRLSQTNGESGKCFLSGAKVIPSFRLA